MTYFPLLLGLFLFLGMGLVIQDYSLGPVFSFQLGVTAGLFYMAMELT